MSKREIEVPAELIEELEESFFQGPMLNESGIRNLNEEQVARIKKMSVKIWPDEHPPPHFHVRFAGEDASFGIADCMRLPGVKGLEKFEHNIKAWWKGNRCRLIDVWNSTRPADCQVARSLFPRSVHQSLRPDLRRSARRQSGSSGVPAHADMAMTSTWMPPSRAQLLYGS
ncbi:DUF4160 domain-containing protein [Pseudohoeflea coraliihabitans]|uniref:DUF4160 domain-containing protein n=1 Tax=Pseudohoeflea coraliihabitans TaxID=2860393 RepID=A0ABS6WMF7_9HYPH|nr:DUF4160 domain-containing protein [Pseudohoeflea sp. DP4N28-3]MBW3097144.1 DUF4160 domain-containing protein [Pseudohoeflea sp. DP4N28-3]